MRPVDVEQNLPVIMGFEGFYSSNKSGRPQQRVHIPLDFKEAMSDLLKVKPEQQPKRATKSKARKGLRKG